jgi:3-hydroxyisobutyrate dehydrogenase-like beta-hydroxyacid dehydrogenase
VAEVGFIGLGGMGRAIVRRLLAAGHVVRAYNRTPGKADALVREGLELVGTPREAAEGSELVLSMVTGSDAVEAVARGADGLLAGLRAGQVWVDMSTCSPTVSRALAGEVASTGARMLDAPVAGSTVTIEQGKLSIIVGGEPEAFAQVEPVLRDIGPFVRHVGDNGKALQLKLAINISIYLQMVAFSEGLVLAERAGVDKELAVEVMLGSVIASPMLQYRGPLVFGQPDEAMFDCALMQKDVTLALQAGRELAVALPTLAVAGELLTMARAAGLGHHDFSIVYEVLSRLAGPAAST